jgi:predicted aspartyl protease
MVRFAGAVLALTALILGARGQAQNTAAADPGLSNVAITATYLQTLLDKADYIEFVRRLPSARGLKPEQEEYFRGILAYREGRLGEVVNPLVTAVRTHNSVLTDKQMESAFEILGQTSEKTFLYSSSAQMYDDIDKLFGLRMGEEVQDIREKRHIGLLLKNVPVETVQIDGDFTMLRSGGELGAEYPINIGGKSFFAQLDTGASVSLLSESTAKDWGVTILEGTVTLHGYGGGGFSARPGLIPVLQIGKAELHNVVVFVTADKNLYIAEIKRQTHALLGFPVASALGRLTFAKDGTLTVTAHPTSTTSGAPMWIGEGSLLVALGTAPAINGDKLTGGTKERLFELDTGSGSTYFTDHYLAENRSRFSGDPSSVARLAGAGGIHEIPAYKTQRLPLFFDNTPVLCTGQHVLTQSQGGEAESYYGVVGQDILQLFSSYTLDFHSMRFSVVP